MANESLAVSSHHSNPVSHLAYLINAALQQYSEPSANYSINYRRELATLMGLAFTAALAEGSKARPCRMYLASFLRNGGLNQHPGRAEELAVTIAQMICNSIYSFKALGYPRYYDDFITALVNLLRSSSECNMHAEMGIKKMMRALFEACG